MVGTKPLAAVQKTIHRYGVQRNGALEEREINFERS